MTGPDSQPDAGRGRRLAAPGFPDDDGSADPAVRASVADESDAAGGVIALARSLRRIRLLSGVVAVADEVDDSGGDKTSHMAAVSMVNERGQRGLLVFTGVDSLAAWSAHARPVPALGREMAQAAISDGSQAVVIDVAGPHRRVITGVALQAMADELDFDRVSAVVWTTLAPVVADGLAALDVVDGRESGSEADVLVTVAATGDDTSGVGTARDRTAWAASLIAASPDLGRLVPGGIGVTSAPLRSSIGE